jgi:hypothetical protein
LSVVAGLEALILLIAVPTIAWLIALSSLQPARKDLARERPDATRETSTGRILIFIGYSGTPVVFGVILFALARPVLDAIDALASGNVVRLGPLLLWASLAFSIASCSAIAAQTAILRSRLAAFFGSGSGRVLPLSVVPTTAAVFALVLLFLLVGYADSVLAGGPLASEPALSGAISSFQAFAVGTVAFPVAAGVSNRIRDLSQRGFARALLIMEVGELPVLVGLVLALLALRAL